MKLKVHDTEHTCVELNNLAASMIRAKERGDSTTPSPLSLAFARLASCSLIRRRAKMYRRQGAPIPMP